MSECELEALPDEKGRVIRMKSQQDLERLNAQLMVERDSYARLLEEHEELLRQCERRIEELRSSSDNRVEEILNSTSWRVTRPLRRTMEILRGTRRDSRTRPAQAAKLSGVSVPAVRRVARRLFRIAPLPEGAKYWIASKFGPRLRDASADPPLENSTLADLVPAWRHSFEELMPAPATAKDRVLVVDWKVPTPDRDSGSYRMFRILRCLSAGGVKVDFASDAAVVTEPRYREALEAMGVSTSFGPEALLRHLIVHGAEYRAVILSRPEVARDYLPMVRAFAVDARVVYDTVDLHWVRFARGGQVLSNAEHLTSKAEQYRRLELANARCADVTVAITEEERSELIAAAPGLNVVVVPNIHELSAKVPPFAERRDMLFIGGFTHEPNVEAVHYFVSKILPRISERLGNVRLNIVGSDMPSDIQRLKAKDVEPLGYVPDVDPLFEQARVFVAPLRHGAGMKGKVGHALSFGLPVVTTSIGAEGIGLISGETALISDDPDEFANMVARLYTDEGLWTRLSSSGRELIASRFSEGVVKEKLIALV